MYPALERRSRLIGALVCAELASAFPQTGGVYVFLREAYSRRLAFLWGWSSVWIIHTGVIAAIAHSRSGGQPIPVRFIGVGEGMDDLRPFVAADFVAALLDT